MGTHNSRKQVVSGKRDELGVFISYRRVQAEGKRESLEFVGVFKLPTRIGINIMVYWKDFMA